MTLDCTKKFLKSDEKLQSRVISLFIFLPPEGGFLFALFFPVGYAIDFPPKSGYDTSSKI